MCRTLDIVEALATKSDSRSLAEVRAQRLALGRLLGQLAIPAEIEFPEDVASPQSRRDEMGIEEGRELSMRPKEEATPTTTTDSDPTAEIEQLLRESRALYWSDWSVERNRARYKAAEARVRAWHAANGPTPMSVTMKFVRETYPNLRAVDDQGTGRGKPRDQS